MTKDYYWYKKHGICTNCGCADAISGHTLCVNCTEIQQKRAARWYANKSEERKKADSERTKQYRSALSAAGKCNRCAKPLEKWSIYKSCEKCRAKGRKYYAQNRNPDTLPAVLRNSYEYCYLCCKPIDKTLKKKLCDECRQKCITNLSKTTPEARERSKKAFKEKNTIFWNRIIEHNKNRSRKEKTECTTK